MIFFADIIQVLNYFRNLGDEKYTPLFVSILLSIIVDCVHVIFKQPGWCNCDPDSLQKIIDRCDKTSKLKAVCAWMLHDAGKQEEVTKITTESTVRKSNKDKTTNSFFF